MSPRITDKELLLLEAAARKAKANTTDNTIDPQKVLDLIDQTWRLRGMASDPEAIERAAKGLFGYDRDCSFGPDRDLQWGEITEFKRGCFRQEAQIALRAALGKEDQS